MTESAIVEQLRPPATAACPEVLTQLEADMQFYDRRAQVNYLRVWTAKAESAIQHPRFLMMARSELEVFFQHHPDWRERLAPALSRFEQEPQSAIRQMRVIVNHQWSAWRLEHRAR